MRTYIRLLKLSCAALLAAALPAMAQINNTWNGSAGANWSTAANWTPGPLNPGDSLIFAGNANTSPNNDFAANTPFGGISFDPTATSGFDLLGNAIDFAGVIENDSTTAQSIDLPIVLTNAATINVTNGSINIGLNGLASPSISGTNSLTVNGTPGGGMLTVSNQTYSGGTLINSGAVMEVQSDNGNYTLAGGSLKLTYGSWYSGANFTFTADSSLGVIAGGPNYNNRGRYDSYGTVGSPGFKWTVVGDGRFQIFGHVAASSVEVTAPAVLGALGNGNVTGLGTNTITVDYGAALRINNGGIVLAPIVLDGGQGPDNQGALVANQEAYSGLGSVATATFSNTITLLNNNGDTYFGAQTSAGNSFPATLAIPGNISGPGGLQKIGPNLLSLSGSNSYAGNTTIGIAGTANSGSALQLGSSNALPATTTLTINENSTLDLNGNAATATGLNDDGTGNGTVDNSSASAASLRVSGASFVGKVKNSGGGPLSIVNVSGTATFLGANSYSGANQVLGGTLEINIPTGTTTGGLVQIADTATLTLHKTTPGSSLKASGATIGTSGATTLNIDLNNYGNSSAPIINATNGTGILAANGTLTINFLNTANLSVGTLPIIRYTTRTGGGNFVLTPIAGITSKIITNTAAGNNYIGLQITGAPITTWKGNHNNLWDTTTANWTLSGSPVLYTDGSAVFFDDTALTNNVNLTTLLSPGSVLINSSSNYVFGGTGPLSGGALTKNGSGTLILDVVGNSYASTTIAGGTLQVGNNDSNGDLGYGNVDDEATLAFSLSNNYTVPGVISGAGVVVQNNTNTITLSQADTYTGGTLINQGVLKAGTTSALGIPLAGVPLATVASGAAFDVAGNTPTVTNAVVISGGGNGTADQGALLSSAGWAYLGGTETGVNALSLAADATIGNNGNWIAIGNNGVNGLAGNGHNLVKVGNGTIAFKASASSALASLTLANGGLLFYNRSVNPIGSTATLIYSNNASSDSWDTSWTGVIVPNNIVIANNGGQINNTHGPYYGQANQDTYNGNVTLNGILTAECISSYTGAPNPGVPTYGKQTFNGTITGTGGISAIIKAGASIILNGAANYTGPTLVFPNTAGLPGGTLLLSTVQQGGGVYTNLDGSVLDVPAQVGYSTVPMSTLALLGTNSGATLSLSRVSALSTSTAPITATNLTIVGTNSVLLPAIAYASAPGEYPLIKYTTGPSGYGTTSLLAIGGGVRGVPGYITNDTANSQIALVIPGGTPVIWTGTGGNNQWDIASTLNWKTNGSATDYEQQPGSLGDAVTFDDSSTQTNVNVTVPVAPTAAIFDITNNSYTLFGTNLTGAASLVKNGTGTLVLSNRNNNFTGGTIVNGGTLKVATALNPLVALNNLIGTVTVAPGATLDMGSNNLTSLIINASGAGVGGNGAIQANYTGGAQGWGINKINQTGNLTVGGNNRWDLRNGSGIAWNVNSNGATLTKVGGGYVGIVAATVSTNLGDITILGGTLDFQTSTTGVGNTNNTIYVGNGGNFGMYQFAAPVYKSIVCSNGAGILIDGGNTVGQNVISGPFVLHDGTTTLKGNYYNGIYFSNSISGPGSLTLQYQTYVYLAASNTFTGTLTVPNCNGGNGGRGTRLSFIGNGSAMTCSQIYLGGIASGQAYAGWISMDTPSATLTLGANQQLRGDNGAYIRGSVVVPATANIAPGGVNNSNYQYMIVGTNLTFQSGSTNYMDIYKTASLKTNDFIIVSNLVTYAGTLVIRTNGPVAITNGDSFKLFQAGSVAGNFTTIADDSGATWSFNPATGVATVLTAPPTVNTNPATANFQGVLSGGALHFTWAPDHQGWQLYTNAVGLTATSSWFPVAGSASGTNATININPAQTNEFFQLRYP